MQGVAIHRAVDGHRGDAEFTAGTQDSQRDFATVGDQQLADGHPIRIQAQRTVSALTLVPCGPVPYRLPDRVEPRAAKGWAGQSVYWRAEGGSPLTATRMWWNW